MDILEWAKKEVEIAIAKEKTSAEQEGDFDTIAVWSLRLPDGSEDIIHKFYKEDFNEECNWKEIDEDEFREREAVCNSR